MMKKILLSLVLLAFISTAFAQSNREWWNNLTPAWKKIFLEAEFKGKDVEPTDEQLEAMVSNLPNVNCASNKEITDLKPLARLRNLKKLDCSSTNIKSLEGIESIINLEDLNCSNNDNLNSLIPIANLKNLVSLNCGNTMVKSLAPLANLINLKVLDVHFCTVNNLSQLSALTRLTSLDVSKNHSLYSITGIEKLTNLVTFDCSETCVEDLSPLQNLKSLENINISNTKVRTLRPLQMIRTIHDIDFSDTRISAASFDYFYAHYAPAMLRGRNLEVTQKEIDDFTTSFLKKNPNCTIVITTIK